MNGQVLVLDVENFSVDAMAMATIAYPPGTSADDDIVATATFSDSTSAFSNVVQLI
jgi:hypothetical protein